MKTLAFFFLLVIRPANLLSQSTIISIKPYKAFTFSKLHLCEFNPVYGTFERLKVSPAKENGYYAFKLRSTRPGFYRIENEGGRGIGFDVYAEPGEYVKLDIVWETDIITAVPRNSQSGNNVLMSSLTDSIKAVYSRIKNDKTDFPDAKAVSANVDSMFDRSVVQTVNKLREKLVVSTTYERMVLNPHLDELRHYFKNTLLQKSRQFAFRDQLMYNDSLMLHPPYYFWTFEFGYLFFKDYLAGRINNGTCTDLGVFLNNISEKYPVQDDSLLHKIAMCTGLKAFFDCNPIGTQNGDRAVRIADSLVAAWSLNPAYLSIPGYINTGRQRLDTAQLHRLNVIALSSMQAASFNTIFRDTNRIYLVDHWASWCIPCLKEIPYSMALQSAYAGLQVIYLSKDTRAEACLAAINRMKMPINNCYMLDYANTDDAQYRIINPSISIPYYVFIYYRHGTYYQEPAFYPSEEKINQQLMNLLKLK